MPLTRSWMARTRAINRSASARLAKVVPAMNCPVRRSRPSMSWRQLECSQTPARASGCSIWIIRALMPPISMEVKSLCTFQHTDWGPNRPGSPRGCSMSTPDRVSPLRLSTWRSMRWRRNSIGAASGRGGGEPAPKSDASRRWAGSSVLAAAAAAEEVDQAAGRAIPVAGRTLAGEAVVDIAAQLLAQLHAPLVEGVDAPDGALHEHFVFVERHQRAEAARVDVLDDQGVAGAVAGNDLVRRQALHFL